MINRRSSVVLLLSFALGCAGTVPNTLGVQASGSLGGCPDSPNCVSSADERPSHNVAPIQLAGDSEQGWVEILASVAALPRTTVIESDGQYVHAESTSSLMGYVDDLELLLDPSSGRVDVRSASRLGYGDMGVNAARVQSLRDLLSAESTNNR
ncbi:MAG: hypothetical protein ACI8W3_001986 [Myxococcota bacterium]|jgi:uncharacterized protein (DUF1499 family)